MTVTAAQLAAEVRRSLEGEPYAVVDETADGFAVHIDVADAHWWSLFHRHGLRKTWRWEVKVTGDRYQVVDRPAEVEWQAGADASGGVPRPRLRFAAKAMRGTAVQISFRKTYGVRDDGSPGAVVDYTFDSREGKRHITDAAERLGLRRQLDWATLTGLYVAVGTVVLMVLGFGAIGIYELFLA